MQINTSTRPLLVAFSISILLASCQSDNSGSGELTGQGDSTMSKTGSVRKIIYSIPPPMEMVSLIKQSGAQFDKSILNSVDRAKSYTGESKLALNLGIYGSALSYASMFDQKQEAMNYFAASQELANKLGVEDVLQNDIPERLRNNEENRDSLLNIVSETYADLNDYLKESNREEISGLVIAGGWVEGLHLATYYAISSGNAELKQRVAEQKLSLVELIKLLGSYSPRPDLAEVLNDLNQIRALFDEAQTTTGKSSQEKDASGTVVIGGGNSITMSDVTLKKISDKIKEIRTKYIS
ncbi:MAG: hypothetical protein SH856_04900 [Flavobacteriales bacterium]|nr:hypothetical protein [Flavobacteriales bacterium]